MRLLALSTAAAAALLAACGPADDGPTPPASSDPQVQAGFETTLAQGCFGCHQAGGEGGRSGPSFDGLAGSQVELDDGSRVTVDDAYLQRAIADPDAQVQKGFSGGIMSSVLSNKRFSQAQLDEMVAYLKTL